MKNYIVRIIENNLAFSATLQLISHCCKLCIWWKDEYDDQQFLQNLFTIQFKKLLKI